MYMAFSKPTEELYFSYSLTDSDGTALRPSVLQKNLSCLFPKLNRKKYPEEEKRYYFNEEDSREFLLQGLLQMKHHPEQIKKNKAFLMLANYWDQYSEKKKDLEKYGQYLEQSYEEPKLSEDLMEELYGKEISGSVIQAGTICCLSISVLLYLWSGIKRKRRIQDSTDGFGKSFP